MSQENSNIIYGGPLTADYIKEGKSLGEFILQRLTEHGDNIAIIDGKAEREVTYNDIKVGTLKIAEYLRREGIGKGDVIGIASENRVEYPFVVFGAFFVGATIATANALYTEDEMFHALNLSKPKIVFGSPNAILHLDSISKRCSFISKVLQFGDMPLVKGITMVNSILSDPSIRINSNFQFPSTNLVEDTSIILLSSGTTGLPKGVQLTQENILAALANMETTMGYLQEDENVVQFSIVPWFHIYGILVLIYACCAKVKTVMLPKFEGEVYLKCLEKYKVTHCAIVPPLIVFMAKTPLLDNYNMSSLRELFSGAAPLSREVEESVMKRIPNLKAIRQGYGMSETTGGVLYTDFIKSGSVGVVGRGIYCKVVDPETGRIMGAYERGELCFKGKIIMKGYLGNDQATKEMIEEDGWLHTGDVGYYDNDKHFFIVDRLKELIKYNGFQVAPAELEAIILSQPKVQDVAVIGKPDENSGELPTAFIVKQPNMKVTEKEIVEFVAEKVSPYKKLRGGVIFIDQIPKNQSGKILRKDLKAMLVQMKSKL